MKIIKLSKLTNQQKESLMIRSNQDFDKVLEIVKPIMKEVKINGDKALKIYSKKFDGVELTDLKVSEIEFMTAYKLVSKDFITAVNQSANNITKFCKAQLKQAKGVKIETQKGIKVWNEWRPIEEIGIYIPGGKAVYPSTVLMTVIPAKVAGCKKVVLVTPVKKDGKVSPYILVTADILGIKDIYKVGGAQAIAALSYGTETIPKVNKIFGPGNRYVTGAKLLAFTNGEVGIDSPAGPSEVMIIADESAKAKWIAADLVCDSEHGEDSAAVLLTASMQLARETANEVNKLLKKLNTGERARKAIETYGLIVVVKNLDEAFDFANNYAPEHIEILTKNPLSDSKRIINAGSVFIGKYSCKSSGDYATGANHVLPTGGAAKMFSALSVLDFGKMVEFQQLSKLGLSKIKKTIEVFAQIEELPAHANSVKVRF